MLWVLQNNLYNEEGYVRFVKVLKELNCKYLVVKPVPFTNRLVEADFDSMKDRRPVEEIKEPYINENEKIIVFGSTTLSRIATVRAWQPGSYINKNFNFEKLMEIYPEEFILNWDANIFKIKDLVGEGHTNPMFVRPVDDSKAFAGKVMSGDEYNWFIHETNKIEYEDEFQPVHREVEILIAKPKNIMVEFRMFVVDSQVITGSMYKNWGHHIKDYNDKIPEEVMDWAQQVVNYWQPAKAFVIDIALTFSGPRIIEINNINSSGFYGADVYKIIKAINKMEEGG